MRQGYTYYFRKNIFVTTSGNFNTKALQYCIDVLGVDQVLYSIDYPYETVEEAQDWWKTLDGTLSKEELQKIGRANAINLLKLPLKA